MPTDDPAAFAGVHRCPRCHDYVPDQEQLGDFCRACLLDYREEVLDEDWDPILPKED